MHSMQQASDSTNRAAFLFDVGDAAERTIFKSFKNGRAIYRIFNTGPGTLKLMADDEAGERELKPLQSIDLFVGGLVIKPAGDQPTAGGWYECIGYYGPTQ